MNVAWPPGSRENCGHPQCRRYTIASCAALLGGDAVVIGFGVTQAGQAHPGIIVAAGCIIAAAGLVLALWPHPHSHDGNLEALARAVLGDIPDHVPDEWTREIS